LGKEIKKKKQSNFEVFGIRFQTCALVKARSEQECWVVVLMIRVRQAVCLSVVDEFNNEQTNSSLCNDSGRFVKFQQHGV
jgi:hypothetical protein